MMPWCAARCKTWGLLGKRSENELRITKTKKNEIRYNDNKLSGQAEGNGNSVQPQLPSSKA